MPLFGPPNIEKLLSRKDFGSLLLIAKSYSNSEIRVKAIRALKDRARWEDRFQHEDVIKTLTKAALHDPNEQVRVAAIETLPQIKGSSYEEQWQSLAEIAQTIQDKALQQVAILGLVDGLLEIRQPHISQVWSARAVKLLVNLNEASIEPLLTRLKSLPAGEFPTYQHEVIAEVLVTLGALSIVPLSNLLQELPKTSGNKAILVTAIKTLGQIGGSHAVEILVNLLQTDLTKPAATFALGKIGDPRVVEFLIPMLHPGGGQAGNFETINAAKLLGQLKDSRATPRLMELAIDEYLLKDVQKAAADAVVEIGDTRAVNQLVAWLEGSGSTVDEKIQNAQNLLATFLDENLRHLDSSDLRSVAHLKDTERYVTRSRLNQVDETELYDVKVSVNNSSLRALALSELQRRG